MGKNRNVGTGDSEVIRVRPAITAEAREVQLAAMAMDLAEQRFLDGTASDSLIIQYIKASSQREKMEEALLEEKVKLAAAKTEAIEAERRIEALYANAIAAMKLYGGHEEEYDAAP